MSRADVPSGVALVSDEAKTAGPYSGWAVPANVPDSSPALIDRDRDTPAITSPETVHPGDHHVTHEPDVDRDTVSSSHSLRCGCASPDTATVRDDADPRSDAALDSDTDPDTDAPHVNSNSSHSRQAMRVADVPSPLTSSCTSLARGADSDVHAE